MRSVIIGLLAAVAVVAAAIPLVAVDRAHEASVAAAAPDKSAIEAIVHAYLVENPEVLVEASRALETKRAAAEQEQQTAALAEHRDQVFNSEHQVVVGNPKGAVTLVEFFDYNCGYCRHALPDLMKLMEKNPDLRVVLKEFPVLGPGSQEAAQIAIGVNAVAPERYLDFHRAMFTTDGPADRKKALAVVASLGLPVDAVEKASADTSAAATVEEVYNLATALGINGTPSFVVGDQVMVGAVGYDALNAGISAARGCSTQSC